MTLLKPKETHLNSLLTPLFADDAAWLEENAPDYYTAVQKAIGEGLSPKAIYTFYMQQAPGRQALWLRVRHAAEFLSRGNWS